MGNCLVIEEKMIRVMEPSGKILEYQAPINVQQVLSNLSGYHALSDSFSGFNHLQLDANLISGKLYYLVPLPSPSSKKGKKKVRFSVPEEVNNNVDLDQGSCPNVVRIKLVISKTELQELLLRKGGVSVKDVVSHIQSKQITTNGIHDVDNNCKGSKLLVSQQSIAQVNL